MLQEQFLNGKVLIFKKRRRKNSRRLNGHRQVSLLQQQTDVLCVLCKALLSALLFHDTILMLDQCQHKT